MNTLIQGSLLEKKKQERKYIHVPFCNSAVFLCGITRKLKKCFKKRKYLFSSQSKYTVGTNRNKLIKVCFFLISKTMNRTCSS